MTADRKWPSMLCLMLGSMLLSSSALRMRGLRARPCTRTARPLGQVDFDKHAENKYFDFKTVEREVYEWWEASGYFKPSTDERRKPFVLPMPPPNVTGYLHMGHAMFVALQDIMARFQRMRGRATLYLPGTDHAGIATQLLVERAVVAEGGSRVAMGRDRFLERVWAWKNEKSGYITGQMRRLGASADWSRERFTLEPDMSAAVTEAFVRLHERGLVYRGDYMVNWSPNLQTAVSDLEVDYVEEQGKLYFFEYALSDGSGSIPVATTRPETILGDAAVCVHPADPRFAAMVGKTVRVPFVNRDIPVIADEYVDMAFGTGALKITPAHDANDYALGKKHSLPLINLMNKDATINSEGGKFAGMDRFACREAIWKELEQSGAAIKVEAHTQRVPRSQRGGEVIEPLVSAQWFVNMDVMAARAVAAVRGGDVQIIPARFEKVWFEWLENIRPWCVSRQLWWGHRIPVYYRLGPQGEATREYVVARDERQAYELARAKFGAEVRLGQDEDVLDTWFSSGLWPFATVGWPQQEGAAEGDLARFYPAAVLETGYDILFFWVARMVMLGLELTDKSPFHTVYMHGLVRDAQGRKMSKTTGNVIDPLDTIDVFGSDALRYTLVTGSTPGQDIPLSLERVEANRNFANKLWNAGKYMQSVLGGVDGEGAAALVVERALSAEEMGALPLPERYVVSACHQLVEQVTAALEGYEFGDAGRQIQEFLWDEFADWFIEVSKTRMRDPAAAARTRRVLVYVWDRCLRLLHPFMPFLTEALWQQIPHRGASVMVADWPKMDAEVLHVDAASIAAFRSFQALVRAVRNARSDYNVEAGKKIGAIVRSEKSKALLESERLSLSLLGRIDEALLVVEDFSGPAPTSNCIHLIVEDGLEVYLPMADMVDKDKEVARLSKQSEKLEKDIAGLESRLFSKGFADKAPAAVVAEVNALLADKKEQLLTIKKSIEGLVAV